MRPGVQGGSGVTGGEENAVAEELTGGEVSAPSGGEAGRGARVLCRGVGGEIGSRGCGTGG